MNLALDCCDKQKSLVVKSQACKLLEHMCDNVDGAATCITTFACIVVVHEITLVIADLIIILTLL